MVVREVIDEPSSLYTAPNDDGFPASSTLVTLPRDEAPSTEGCSCNTNPDEGEGKRHDHTTDLIEIEEEEENDGRHNESCDAL